MASNVNPDPFTTRPEIEGTFGVVATTHWIATAVGMAILEKGGYVPANLKLASPAQKLPLKFVDPAVVLDETDKWKKHWDEIVLRNAAK